MRRNYGSGASRVFVIAPAEPGDNYKTSEQSLLAPMCKDETKWISSATNRKKLVANRSVVMSASEQRRRSVTFCGKEEWRSGMKNPQPFGWGF